MVMVINFEHFLMLGAMLSASCALIHPRKCLLLRKLRLRDLK